MLILGQELSIQNKLRYHKLFLNQDVATHLYNETFWFYISCDNEFIKNFHWHFPTFCPTEKRNFESPRAWNTFSLIIRNCKNDTFSRAVLKQTNTSQTLTKQRWTRKVLSSILLRTYSYWIEVYGKKSTSLITFDECCYYNDSLNCDESCCWCRDS